MTEILAADGSSDFDAIKRVDEHGEYWMARDLMAALDYASWRNFEATIKRAMSAAINSGAPDGQFVQVNEVVAGGNLGPQRRVDYRLTRFGAYLLMMNGDSDQKPKVAEAQRYFAVKTREAEVAPAFDPSKLSRLEILKLAMQAEEEKAVLEAALESAAPAIEYHDRFVRSADVLLVKVWGALFGLTEPQARDRLVEKNIIYRIKVGEYFSESEQKWIEEFEWRARAGRVTFTWFDLRPQHKVRRRHNGQVRQTLYVRQQYALELGKKVGLTPVAVQEALPDGGES